MLTKQKKSFICFASFVHINKTFKTPKTRRKKIRVIRGRQTKHLKQKNIQNNKKISIVLNVLFIKELCYLSSLLYPLSIRQPTPEAAYVLLWVPFASVGPCRCYAVVCSRFCALMDIIIEPTRVSAFTVAVEVVYAFSPRTWIKHFVCICV